MFIIKNTYYFYIENTQDINFKKINKNKKINIIYRDNGRTESPEKIKKFRYACKLKGFKFYISNNIKLLKYCRGDGLYLSSYNKKNHLNSKFNLIGSAHNFKEINQKFKQGCKTIILSRLFKTTYTNKKSFLGILKFNLLIKHYPINLIPLGGIRSNNLLKLNLVNGLGFALFSEIKKKPAISNRLF